MSKKYILNSAVITTEGIYTYKLITLEEAREWILKNKPVSTIGYPQTAEVLSKITGIEIPVNRTQIKMETGDEALVFRLTVRLIDVSLKGNLSEDFIRENCEIGMLKKIRG